MPSELQPLYLRSDVSWNKLEEQAEDVTPCDVAFVEAMGREVEARGRPRAIRGKIAIINAHGGYSRRGMGGTSYEMVGGLLERSVRDSDVGAIVLDIDSPGGEARGMQELSRQVFAARDEKPIFAIANDMAASAGYYLASSASSVSVTPSGEVGSIGTIVVHGDHSKQLEAEGVKPTIITSAKFKAEGNPYEPLTEEAQAELQDMVNDYGARFENDVARNRGITAAQVREDFGQGRMFRPDQAKRRGMVDAIETLPELLARLGARQSNTRDRARLQKMQDIRVKMLLTSVN